jgi:hypothetical protein
MNRATQNDASSSGGNYSYTFLLPVTFQLQLTFPEAEVDASDADNPEIRSEALEVLKQELLEVLGQNYVISELDIADDGLAALFLGKNED